MTHALATTAETAPGRALSLVTSRPDPLMTAVNAFEQMQAFAATLVKSGFLPKAINTPEKAIAVMLAGREMGIGPMQSVRSINIIDAKPVVAADLQLARFKADGGRAAFLQLDDAGAVLQLVHPNGDEHTESFTIQDAAAAQLLGKDNWKKHKKAMLRSRVITAGLKSIGYEPVAGVYDPDEADHWRPGASTAIARGDDPNLPAADYTVEDENGARPTSAPESKSGSRASATDDSASSGTMSGANTTKAAGEAEPACPKCGGAMWNNTVGKTNPRAPDYKCKDKSCEGLYWPGAWPPKVKELASDMQREKIRDLMAQATLTVKQREKIAGELADADSPMDSERASYFIGWLNDRIAKVEAKAKEEEAAKANDPQRDFTSPNAELKELPF